MSVVPHYELMAEDTDDDHDLNHEKHLQGNEHCNKRRQLSKTIWRVSAADQNQSKDNFG